MYKIENLCILKAEDRLNLRMLINILHIYNSVVLQYVKRKTILLTVVSEKEVAHYKYLICN